MNHDNHQEDGDGSQPVPCLATRTLKLQAFGSSHRKAAIRLGTQLVDCRFAANETWTIDECLSSPCSICPDAWLRRLSLEQGQRLASGEQVH